MVAILLFTACQDKQSTKSEEIPVVSSPAEMDGFVKMEIVQLISSAEENASSRLDDSTLLHFLPVISQYYANTDHLPVWSSQENWKPFTDSLLAYLGAAKADGLFPEHYQFRLLNTIKQQLDSNTRERKNPRLWAKADLLLSDAYFHVLQDLKQGRLQPDSLSWKYNKQKQKDFFALYLNRLLSGDSISSITSLLQPQLKEYVVLKKSIPAFLDSMDDTNYTYLKYPTKDSIAFLKTLLLRLGESGIPVRPHTQLDSASLSELLKQYQQKAGLKSNGQLSAALVSSLNNTDKEKLKRIAITLDKYKKLPERLPEQYIWVNLPTFQLKVWEKDSLALESRVIIGKPGTPTPRISSQVSDLVIFPTWTVPNSIITKEILPGLKRSPGYLQRKGLALYSNDGDEVDPWSVNWSRYTKGIPFYVRQASGDNNALGLIKFNFKNPYSVYLHDTNQRYLFKNKMRSLSHGCVRVEEWKKLAFYITRNDSLYHPQPDSLNFNTDSITAWIARKERHVVPIKKQIPIFILYFGCEAAKGRVRFYDDVYGEDKVLREKYFAHK